MSEEHYFLDRLISDVQDSVKRTVHDDDNRAVSGLHPAVRQHTHRISQRLTPDSKHQTTIIQGENGPEIQDPSRDDIVESAPLQPKENDKKLLEGEPTPYEMSPFIEALEHGKRRKQKRVPPPPFSQIASYLYHHEHEKTKIDDSNVNYILECRASIERLLGSDLQDFRSHPTVDKPSTSSSKPGRGFIINLSPFWKTVGGLAIISILSVIVLALLIPRACDGVVNADLRALYSKNDGQITSILPHRSRLSDPSPAFFVDGKPGQSTMYPSYVWNPSKKVGDTILMHDPVCWAIENGSIMVDVLVKGSKSESINVGDPVFIKIQGSRDSMDGVVVAVGDSPSIHQQRLIQMEDKDGLTLITVIINGELDPKFIGKKARVLFKNESFSKVTQMIM